MFSASNPDKKVRYQLSLRPDELICNCQDWSNQKEHLGKACCKHCYSVLNYLNYEFLKEYIERKEESLLSLISSIQVYQIKAESLTGLTTSIK